MKLRNNVKQVVLCMMAFVFVTTTSAIEKSTEKKADHTASKVAYSDFVTTIKGNRISTADLNQRINMLMDSIGIPGLSIAIINDAKIVYHNVFGVTNMETKEKVTDNSIFEAASISKPLFAYFVMLQPKKDLSI